jgi:UDP-glucose 4-epimerase
MKIFIPGGAGYIGAHIVEQFIENGHEVVAFDNFVTGEAERLKSLCEVIRGDIRNIDEVSKYLDSTFDGVINLAALKSVSESKVKQDLYRDVNFYGARNLLLAAEKANVTFFIQSSTAAVYGEPIDNVVSEDAELRPISPYGDYKLMAENAVKASTLAGKLRGTSLRYFNVAGSKTPIFAEKQHSNLIPIVLDNLMQGVRPTIFGNDYATKDGTCVRDFIHVSDIAHAHYVSATTLMERNFPSALNIGTGSGYSVNEVVSMCIQKTRSHLSPIYEPRRLGDPSSLIADISLARDVLFFETKHDLESMIESSVKNQHL